MYSLDNVTPFTHFWRYIIINCYISPAQIIVLCNFVGLMKSRYFVVEANLRIILVFATFRKLLTPKEKLPKVLCLCVSV